MFYATNPAASRTGVFAAAAAALVVSSLLAVLAGAVSGAGGVGTPRPPHPGTAAPYTKSRLETPAPSRAGGHDQWPL
ncbi:MAG: hypothetical protein ACREM3_23095 [Candidatus Rokuibacteriota bacterium]